MIRFQIYNITIWTLFLENRGPGLRKRIEYSLYHTYHHQYHRRRSSRHVGFVGSYHRRQTKSCVVHCSATSSNQLLPLRVSKCCPTQRRLVLMVRVTYSQIGHIGAPNATDPTVRWPNEIIVVPSDCRVFLLIIHSFYIRSPITKATHMY